jgi:hypothetical protein
MHCSRKLTTKHINNHVDSTGHHMSYTRTLMALSFVTVAQQQAWYRLHISLLVRTDDSSILAAPPNNTMQCTIEFPFVFYLAFIAVLRSLIPR